MTGPRPELASIRGFAQAHALAKRHRFNLGARVRFMGTVRVSNEGSMRFGNRVLLQGSWESVLLSTLPGGELVVEDSVFVNYGADIAVAAKVRIGAWTRIGPRVSIADHSAHPIDATKSDVPKPVDIGEDVWIGRNAIILPGVTIGRGALVAAGSIVTKDVEDCTLVAGNPARPIRTLEMPLGFHR